MPLLHMSLFLRNPLSASNRGICPSISIMEKFEQSREHHQPPAQTTHLGLDNDKLQMRSNWEEQPTEKLNKCVLTIYSHCFLLGGCTRFGPKRPKGTNTIKIFQNGQDNFFNSMCLLGKRVSLSIETTVYPTQNQVIRLPISKSCAEKRHFALRNSHHCGYERVPEGRHSV